MAPDSRSSKLRGQIEASKQQQNELERQADELRRRADLCGAEQRDLEGRLTLAVAKEAAASNAGSLLVGDGITDDTLLHIAGFLPTERQRQPKHRHLVHQAQPALALATRHPAALLLAAPRHPPPRRLLRDRQHLRRRR